jgi:hypothetical protein
MESACMESSACDERVTSEHPQGDDAEVLVSSRQRQGCCSAMSSGAATKPGKYTMSGTSALDKLTPVALAMPFSFRAP